MSNEFKLGERVFSFNVEKEGIVLCTIVGITTHIKEKTIYELEIVTDYRENIPNMHNSLESVYSTFEEAKSALITYLTSEHEKQIRGIESTRRVENDEW